MSDNINPRVSSDSRKNRILVIAPQPFFSTRGTPINVKAMAEVLLAVGYEVTILTLPYGVDVEKLSIERVQRIPLSSSPPIGPSITKFLYATLLFLKAIKLSRRFDLIHGIEEGALIAGAVSLLNRTPYIADVDSCMVTQLRDSGYSVFLCDKLFGVIENFFLKRARAAITVCEALTISARQRAPMIPIYQVEDFPMEDSLVVLSSKYEEIKSRFPDKRILLYTGNLEGYQGVELMIRSFSRYLITSNSDQDSVLLIVGGSEHSISKMRQLASDCKIESRVIFEGQRPSSEMGAYMASSEFLVSPRTFGQNVPLKLYTYLASGKPLIATNILSHTQIISNESAFLGEPTIEGLALAFKDAINSVDAKKRAKAGLELVLSKYSKEHFKNRILAAYSEILPGISQTTRLDAPILDPISAPPLQ